MTSHHRILAVVALLAPLAAQADRRAYVQTYEYTTLPRGDAELEIYSEFKDANLANSVGDSWKHQLELEYGITDHWDVSLYQVFVQGSGKSLAYDGFKVRTRYRFGERGLAFVDPLLYFEVIRTANFAAPWKLEGKLILAKTIGRFNVSTNLVYEQNASLADMHPEMKYLVGGGWEFSPAFKLGAEAWGVIEPEDGEIELQNYAGPVVSLAAKGLWFALGAGLGIGEHSAPLQIRSIVGIDL